MTKLDTYTYGVILQSSNQMLYTVTSNTITLKINRRDRLVFHVLLDENGHYDKYNLRCYAAIHWPGIAYLYRQ